MYYEIFCVKQKAIRFSNQRNEHKGERDMMKKSLDEIINVVLIDGQQLFREGVKHALENEGRFHVVTNSDDFSVLDAAFSSYEVDVLLVGQSVFHKHVDEIEEIINTTNVKVVVIGSINVASFGKAALLAGVQGYVVEETSMFAFVDAVQKVSQGQYFYDPNITGEIIPLCQSILKQDESNQVEPEINRPTHLYTKRECEVMQLLTDGCTNDDIAKAMSISDKTVKNHISNIFKKMHVHDRTKVVITAIKNDWVEFQKNE